MAATVDEYLEEISNESFRTALSDLRALIREIVPDAEEKIAWGVPSYYVGGMLVGFAAFKNHCAFFPGSALREFTSELAGFKVGKGTIQFLPDKPIPPELVRKLVSARLAERGLASVTGRLDDRA